MSNPNDRCFYVRGMLNTQQGKDDYTTYEPCNLYRTPLGNDHEAIAGHPFTEAPRPTAEASSLAALVAKWRDAAAKARRKPNADVTDAARASVYSRAADELESLLATPAVAASEAVSTFDRPAIYDPDDATALKQLAPGDHYLIPNHEDCPNLSNECPRYRRLASNAMHRFGKGNYKLRHRKGLAGVWFQPAT